jgi:predicted NBD/HSP70 family sugar kinase
VSNAGVLEGGAMQVSRVPPGSQSSLREANRSRLLGVVKREGAMTQVELATATGLSPATVSTIIAELVAGGVVDTAQVTRSGRRAIKVTLSRGLGLVAGLHFSSRHMRLVLCDPLGTVVAERHMPLAADHRADTDMDRAAQLISDLLDELGAANDELLGAGLGICAPYNPKTDMIAVPGLLRGWDEVAIGESMGRRLGKPVVADNDANLAMLGEAAYGGAKGARSAVCVLVGQGVGAGILTDGKLLRGTTGAAGEIGHVRVVENGPICKCGNRGCLESVASSQAIAQSVRPALGNVTTRDVIALAHQGDIGCCRVIGDAANHVAVALAALCNLVDPELVIVGGELADAGAVFLAPLQAAVERNVLHHPLTPLRLQAAALGDDAAVMGAVAWALDSIDLPVGHVELSA